MNENDGRLDEDDVDELSEQIALPEIDHGVEARFQRSRQRRVAQFFAVFEKALRQEFGNNMSSNDAAEIIRQLPDALTNLAKKRRAVVNSQKATEKRIKKVSETWHPPAKELAKQKRIEDSCAAKAAVARYIRNHWPLDNFNLPSDDRALLRLVHSMEQSGELPVKMKKDRTSPR